MLQRPATVCVVQGRRLPGRNAIRKRHIGPRAMEATTRPLSPCAKKCARVAVEIWRFEKSRRHRSKERRPQRWHTKFGDGKRSDCGALMDRDSRVSCANRDVRLRIWDFGCPPKRDFPWSARRLPRRRIAVPATRRRFAALGYRACNATTVIQI